MSSSPMRVRFADGTILYGKFQGTTSHAITTLCTTPEEVWSKWEEIKSIDCSCGTTMEPVEIATDYGGGMTWDGLACRNCKCLSKDYRTRQPHEGSYPTEGYGGFGGFIGREESQETNHLIHELPEWWERKTA